MCLHNGPFPTITLSSQGGLTEHVNIVLARYQCEHTPASNEISVRCVRGNLHSNAIKKQHITISFKGNCPSYIGASVTGTHELHCVYKIQETLVNVVLHNAELFAQYSYYPTINKT